jgi:hypothetical protein
MYQSLVNGEVASLKIIATFDTKSVWKVVG